MWLTSLRQRALAALLLPWLATGAHASTPGAPTARAAVARAYPADLHARGQCVLETSIYVAGIPQDYTTPEAAAAGRVLRKTTDSVLVQAAYQFVPDSASDLNDGRCDGLSVDASRVTVKLNGVDVTAQLSGTSGAPAKLVGYLAVADGQMNVMTASVGKNTAGNSILYFMAEAHPAVRVSLTPHNDEHIDPSLCVASCFEVTQALSTPAYISRDQARAGTVVYRSGRAAPRGQVIADIAQVADTGYQAPVRVGLALRKPDHTLQTLVGGATEQFFTVRPQSDTGRVGVQFDAGGLATGAYDYTLVVRSLWADTVTRTTETPVRVLVVNERASPYGAGWMPADLQRVVNTPHGLLITTGTGEALYFDSTGVSGGVTSYAAPKGDFSSVTAKGDSVVRRWADSSTAVFDRPNGRIRYTEDRFHNRVSFDYDSAGRLLYLWDPAGQRITFAYETGACWCKLGTLRMMRTPDGRETWFGVDSATSDLTQALNAGGHYDLIASYDADHRLVRNSAQGQEDFAYDFTGRMAADSSPAFGIDSTHTRRLVMKYASAEAHLFPNAGAGQGTFTSPNTTARFQDVVAVTTMPSGLSTAFTTDRLGALRWTQTPAGTGPQTSVTRNAHGQTTRIDGPQAGIWQEYEWLGPNLARYRTSGDVDIHYAYESKFSQLQHVTGTTAEVVNSYDTSGRLVSSRVGSGADTATTRFGSTASGRDTLVIAPNGTDTTVVFLQATGLQNTDSVRIWTRTVRLRRDSTGRVVATVAPDLRRDSTVYDPLNRVTGTLSPDSAWTRFYYGAVALDSVVDAKHQVYGFRTNRIGLDTASIDPLGQTTRALPDSAGNIATLINRRNMTTTFRYDVQGRPVQRKLSNGDSADFVYDPDGRFVVARSPAAVDTIWIDSDTLAREVSVRNGVRYEVREQVNQAAATIATIVQKTTGTPWQRTVTATFDTLYRLSDLTPAGVTGTHIGYGRPGTADTIFHAGGTERTYLTPRQNAELSRIERLVNTALARTYAYDSSGRVISIQSGSTQSGSQENYQYDLADRLTTSSFSQGLSCVLATNASDGTTCPQGSGQIYTFYGTYDAVGNPRNGTVTTGNRLTKFNGDSMHYDADGNLDTLISNGVTYIYQWNSVGQLTSATSSSQGTVTFLYDGFGRRIRRQTSSDTLDFVYRDQQVVADARPSGTLVASYTYFPGIDRPHTMQLASGTTYWYLADGNDNILGLVDASGTLQARYGFDAFGAPIAATTFDNVGNRYRFAGREYDEELHLYFNRARYYSPALRRFISQDPIGLNGGINTYAYLGNNPAAGRDPFGLCTWIEWVEQGGRVNPSVFNTIQSIGIYGRWSGCGGGSGGSGEIPGGVGGGQGGRPGRETILQSGVPAGDSEGLTLTGTAFGVSGTIAFINVGITLGPDRIHWDNVGLSTDFYSLSHDTYFLYNGATVPGSYSASLNIPIAPGINAKTVSLHSSTPRGRLNAIGYHTGVSGPLPFGVGFPLPPGDPHFCGYACGKGF